MFSKKEFGIVSNLRFISIKISCSAELSMKKSFITSGPGLNDIDLFSCSTQLSMKFVLLINPKLLIIASFFLLNIAEHENFSAYRYADANYCWHCHIYLQRKVHAQLS